MPVETLRPNATVQNPNLTVNDTTAHGATSDGSDATHVSGAAPDSSSGRTVLGLDDSTFSADAKVKAVRIRIRCRRDGGTETSNFVRTRPQLSGAVGVEDRHRPSTSFVDFTGTWRSDKPGGGEWTKSDVDAADIALAHSKEEHQTAELFLDVDFDERPVADPSIVEAVDDVVATTGQPTVDLGFSDPEDDPKDAHHIRVFDGHTQDDPLDDAGLVQDTDVVTNTAAAHQLDGLTNGLYRAWVRVRQSWDGHGEHWSEWESVDWTQDAEAPSPPTLTLTHHTDIDAVFVSVSDPGGEVGAAEFDAEADYGGGFVPVRATLERGPQVTEPDWHTDDQKTASSATNDITLEAPGNIAAGDLLLAVIGTRFSTTQELVFTAPPAGWELIRAEHDTSSIFRPSVSWYAKIATADDETETEYVWSGGPSPNFEGLIGRVTGHDAVNPVADDSGANAAAVASLEVPSVASDGDGLLLGAWAIRTANDPAPVGLPASMTELHAVAGDSSAPGFAVASEEVNDGATGPRTATSPDDLSMAGAMIVVRGKFAFEAFDFEPPLNRAVTYRARAAAFHSESGDRIVSDWAADTVTLTSGKRWITDVQDPERLHARLRGLMGGHTRTWQGRQHIHHPAGMDTAVVESEPAIRHDRFLIASRDAADREALEYVAATERTLLFRDRRDAVYVRVIGDSAATQTSPDAAPTDLDEFTVEVVKVARPPVT